MLRACGPRAPWPWVALAVAFLLSWYTIRNNLYEGQSNAVVLALFVFGLVLAIRARWGAAGVLWAAMALIKPFTGVLLLYALWRRGPRAIAPGALAGLIVLILSFQP